MEKSVINMETTSKYYTPDISEFHVGFECEIRLPNWENFKKYEPLDFDTQKTKELIQDNNIRVKYLDRKDIEELGFAYLEELSAKRKLDFIGIAKTIKSISTINDSFGLYGLHQKYCYYTIDYRGSGKMFLRKGDTYTEYAGNEIFVGTVKNKSAFKVLLKQLGIL